MTIKQLGRNEYNRRMLEIKRRQAGIKPRQFSGLSLKTLTRSEYDKLRYKMLKQEIE